MSDERRWGRTTSTTLALVTAIGCASAAGSAPADSGGGVVGAPRTAAVTVCDAVWHDAARDRDVPVRIRQPDGDGPFPLILFSHGLGGSLDAGTAWAETWSAAGFAVIHLQHPGSDQSLWIDERGAAARLAALKSGATASQLLARAGDVRFVLDEVARRTREGDCDLSRLDLTRVGMSGHSFGAVTTEAVAGEVFPGARGLSLKEPRVKAAIAFSPSAPAGAEQAVATAFQKVTIPFFSVTGTEDVVPLLNDDPAERRTLPYESMPPGGKYLLVFDGGTHADFSGTSRPGAEELLRPSSRLRRPLRGRAGQAAEGSNEHIDEVVKAATLAFWRWTLQGNEEARAFLEEGGVTRMLDGGDRFEWK